MFFVDDLLWIALVPLLLQFIGAIIGPRGLKVVSFLAVAGFAALAIYFGLLAYEADTPGMQSESLALAIGMGFIAVVLFVAHFVWRSIFTAMARATH